MSSSALRRAAIQRGTPSCTLLVTALRMPWYAVLIECMSRRSEVGPPRLSSKGDGEQPSLLFCACVCCTFTRRKSSSAINAPGASKGYAENLPTGACRHEERSSPCPALRINGHFLSARHRLCACTLPLTKRRFLRRFELAPWAPSAAVVEKRKLHIPYECAALPRAGRRGLILNGNPSGEKRCSVS